MRSMTSLGGYCESASNDLARATCSGRSHGVLPGNGLARVRFRRPAWIEVNFHTLLSSY
jgi:hypothetical protein